MVPTNSEELRNWIKVRGFASHAEAARALQISESHLSNVLAGRFAIGGKIVRNAVIFERQVEAA